MNQIEVLAIEDNAPDAQLIGLMLKAPGSPMFTFARFSRLAEGIAAEKEKKFDVVLLDLGLPDSQGLDTVERFRKECPSVPVVVLTGMNDEAIAMKALQIDVQDYLVKGQINSDALSRSIRYSIERKRAVTALRESEARFRRLSESGIIGVAFFDTEGQITEANDTYLKMVGYTREELRNGAVRWDRLTPSEWMPRTLEAIAEFERSGRISQYEKEYLRKDGSRFWGLFGGARLEGQPGGIAFVLDITERKKAETQLQIAKVLSDELNDINKLVHSTMKADSVMESAMSEGCRALNADGATIGMFESDSILMRHVYHMPDSFAGCRCSLEQLKAVNEAAHRRDTIVSGDVLVDARFDGRFWNRFGVRSLMLAPLIVRTEVFGVLIFCSSRRFAFGDIQLDFGKKLAASLSLAVENSKLFQEVQQHQERISFLAAALDDSTQPFIARYPDGRPMYFNKAFLELLGYGAQEMRSTSWQALTPAQWHDQEKNVVRRLLLAGEPQLFEKEYVRKDGTSVPVEMKLHAARRATGEPAYYYAFATDITERKRKEEEMRQLALHDPLTGLPNRRLSVDIIGIEREQAKRDGKKMAVLFLDLDRFKEVNDTLGHDAGDLLLKEAASRLRQQVRKSDTIARIGGDEFTIILTGVNRVEDAADVAHGITEAFRKPFRIAGRDLSVTTSVGISVYPDDSDDTELLLKFADAAMYDAKTAGKNDYRFFDRSINAALIDRLRLETMLRRGINSGEMVAYYQPLVDSGSSRIVSAEAFARWRHPERGILSPKDFMGPAEDAGFIGELDGWMLRTVTGQMRSWREAGLPQVSVTLNLSAVALHADGFIGTVLSVLEHSGLPASALSFEVTEKAVMSDIDRAATRLRELSDLGVRISIDDLGAGNSWVTLIERLPLSSIKIDRSVIRDIPAHRDREIVVRSLAAIAHAMRMKIAAAGVETEDQKNFLRAAGYDEMQGYFFSKPLPPEEFGELLVKKAA